MKTFEQFLTEAGAGQGRKVRVRDASGPTNIPQGMSARKRNKIEQQMASQQRGGTSPDEARMHLQAQLAAQKAAEREQQAATRAQQESQAKLAGAAEALAAQKQDPSYIEQQKKLERARERSARRAARKANP
jgi:hypothetical protein